MNVNTQTTEVEKIQANAQAQAKMAADAAAEQEKSAAVIEAVKTIKSSVKNAASVAGGVFQVMVLSKDIAAAYGAFETAERTVIQEWKKTNPEIRTMKDVCNLTGVSEFSYTSIRNKMLKAASDCDSLVINLQALYDFQYDILSKEEQAKEAHQYVENGFLNPWHSRYAKRTPDDEAGHTKFNRDRRLAEGSLKALTDAKRVQDKARAEAEKRAAAKLAQDAATGTVADTAPAGSGQTEQGMASGTRGGRVLSVVVQQAMNLLINAVHHASDYLADSEVLPILGNAADKLEALIAAEQELERKKTSEQSQSHDKPVGLVKPPSIQQEEWDSLNDEEKAEVIQDPEAGLPDVSDPADDSDMSDEDKKNLASAIEQDLERKSL